MNNQTLGGTMFVHNGIKFDYCFAETIKCLCALCDEVVILDSGSTDGTIDQLLFLKECYPNLKIIFSGLGEWDSQQGHQKLAYFTNIAISHLTTDWNIMIQADEILHEKCFPEIRRAIEDPHAEAYLVSRINLWKDPYHQLNVPYDRLPCSKEVIRLAKSKYMAIGDAESIGAPATMDYLEDIRIYHMGFVRKKEIMPAKIRHMQADVFLTQVDHKLEGMEIFDSTAWFTDADLEPIKEPLPIFIQEWAKERP